MSNYAAETARKYQSSNIFFSEGSSNQTYTTTKKINNNTISNIFKHDESTSASNKKVNNFHNKSDIFCTSGNNESFQNSKRSVLSNRTETFLENSENERIKKDKNKQNYDEDRNGKNETNHFDIDFDNKNTMNKLSDTKLSAKERKLLTYRTSHDTRELQIPKHLYPKINNEEKSFKTDNALESKVVEMKSNIFHDPGKDEINQTFKPHRIQSNKEKEIVKELPRATKVSSNNWNANIDWKDSKNEILFHKNDKSNEDKSSALERKIKDLQGNILSDHKGIKINPVPNPIDNNREEKLYRGEIKNSLEANLSNDRNRLRKNLELSSIGQGSDFYKSHNNFSKSQNQDVKSYEIKNLDNFSNFKIDDIESVFRKKGYELII